MRNKISFLQVFTQYYYHSVPSDLEMMTLSPEREAIFNYLSQIGSDRFPEFILDVLVHVQGHKPIDITDGTGDEKQDILTIDTNGFRHLTQCKHTLDYKEHYSGDELDYLFAACFRKNCRKGLLVTNSDLTAPAKRYITDKEYARGGSGSIEAPPEIDYWNAYIIWQLIAKKNAILNKWFSGMGQSHGLRRFTFNLVVQQIPSANIPQIKCLDIINAIKHKTTTKEIPNSNSYEIILDQFVKIIISDWFHNNLNLGVPYVGPETEHELVNIPLWALKVQVEVSSDIGVYNPAGCRDFIVKFIGDYALPQHADSNWWHLIATTPQAFVFLQDILEPKVISVSHAESYVKIGLNPVTNEKKWVFLDDDRSTERSGSDKDTLEWRHIQTGTDITLMIEQRPHPIARYEYCLRQFQIVDKIKNYKFRTIENASQEIIDRVRRTVDPEWVIMMIDNKHLLWAFPPNENRKKAQKVIGSLKRQGVSVQCLNDEERDKLLSSADFLETIPSWTFISTEPDLVTPVWLDKRVFMLSREKKIRTPPDIDKWIELVKFKAAYEVKYGFDFMQGKQTTMMASEEIKVFLFDLLTFRGNRMLDFQFYNGTLLICLRIKEKSLDSSLGLIDTYLKEMDEIVNNIIKLCGETYDVKIT